MKKLMTALAVCVVASLAFAAGSGVTSANIVGYKTVAVTPGFNMVSLNWDNVGGGGMNIQNLVDKSGLKKGDSSSADQLILFDNTSKAFTAYFLYSSTASPALDNKWIEYGQATPANVTVSNGRGFWLNRRSSATNTVFSGQVKQDATASYSFTPGFNMFGNQFAADLGLNDQAWTNAKKGDSSSADQLIVFDNTTKAFTAYFLYSSTGNPALDNKWIEYGQATPTTAKLLFGNGAWYNRRGASDTISIPKPY